MAKRRGQKPKVILVDDDMHLMLAVGDYLQRKGQLKIVGTVHDGQAGVAFAKNVEADLVLHDISMPGMDPWLACREIVRHTNSKVLFYTAGVATTFVDLCRKSGGSGVLSKQEPFHTVGDAVRRVIAGEEYYSNAFYSRMLQLNGGQPVSPAASLTNREREILRLMVEGRTNAEIAKQLGSTPQSVHRSIKNMQVKANAQSTAELGAWAVLESLVSPYSVCADESQL